MNTGKSLLKGQIETEDNFSYSSPAYFDIPNTLSSAAMKRKLKREAYTRLVRGKSPLLMDHYTIIYLMIYEQLVKDKGKIARFCTKEAWNKTASQRTETSLLEKKIAR